MNNYTNQSSSILPDHEIDDILFSIPDESDDDLDLGDLDELVYDFDEQPVSGYEKVEDFEGSNDHNFLDENVELFQNDDSTILINVPHLPLYNDQNNDISNTNIEVINTNIDLSISTDTPSACSNQSNSHRLSTKRKPTFTPITSVKWRKNSIDLSPDSVKFKGNCDLPVDILSLTSTLDFFNYFFTNDLLQHICEETLIYSIQKDVHKPLAINEVDLKKFLGICIMTTVHQNTSIRKYWSENVGNDIIKSTMTVNMFEKIKQLLHFNNNQNNIPVNQPGHDRLYRLHPILETLKNRFII